MTHNALACSLIVLAGCATPGLQPVSSERTEVPAVQETRLEYDDWVANAQATTDALQRLDALDVLEVGELIVDAPPGSQNCYGPCADEPIDQAWMVEHASQVERLVELVDTVELTLESELDMQPGAYERIDEAVDALNALAIIEVIGLNNTGACYFSCEQNIAVALEVAEALLPAPAL